MDINQLPAIFDALQEPLPLKLSIIQAPALSDLHYLPFSPEAPALLLGVSSAEIALKFMGLAQVIYPSSHVLYCVAAGRKRQVRLKDLLACEFSESTSLYLPPLGVGVSLEAFAEVVAHLRAPDGCPWDKKQTHQTLRTHLLEEAYEALTAMDQNDPSGMCEEFGDLLLQIVLNAQIASETSAFSMPRIIQGIYDKIVRRHPHVFGDVEVDSAVGVLQNWEKLKEQERRDNGAEENGKGLLDGVPLALPALTQALEYQGRAARVGFDWAEIDGVLDKIQEEVQEVQTAQDTAQVIDELGDLFFALVNLARWRNVDAESALRGANAKFKKRFSYIEQNAKRQQRNLSDLTLAEMDFLWDEAKQSDL